MITKEEYKKYVDNYKKQQKEIQRRFAVQNQCD